MSRDNTYDITRFSTVVDLYQARLFRFVFMRVGNREMAEDLLQDVFMGLFRKLSEGCEIRDMEHYLLHSVNNVCIDYYRKKRPQFVSIDEAESLPVESDREIYEEFRRIRLLLDNLPEEQAETLRLKCYDNLTFRQIAELHQVAETTVKSRYRYAIRNIQKRLKRE